MTEGSNDEIVVLPPARRALTQLLPEAVATAAVEFVTTALLTAPKRVGKPLRPDLAGVWSARRSRALYRIREQGRPGEEQGGEDRREVIVLHIEHRRDVYRPFPAEDQAFVATPWIIGLIGMNP